MVNVYAACTLKDKKILWVELSNIKATSQDLVWCFCGDFKGFNSFIDANLLLDLPFVGKKFTWFNSNGSAKSRLDRVLFFEEWLQKWPMCNEGKFLTIVL